MNISASTAGKGREIFLEGDLSVPLNHQGGTALPQHSAGLAYQLSSWTRRGWAEVPHVARNA